MKNSGVVTKHEKCLGCSVVKKLNCLYFNCTNLNSEDLENKVKNKASLTDLLNFVENQVRISYNSPNNKKMKVFLSNIYDKRYDLRLKINE